MKYFVRLFSMVVLLVASSGTGRADHQVTRWRHGRGAAVSVTFDDGLPSHVTVGAPLLDERNLRGTFYVLTQDEWNEWPGYWDDWRALAAAGHEIGSHTLSHAQLSTLSEAEMRVELEESRDIVDAEVTTQSCLTIAYPYGDYDDLVEEVTADYYIAGRTVWSPLYLNFYPGDPYAPMDAFAVGSYAFDWPAITTLEALVGRVDSAEEYGAWFIPHIHALTDPLAVSVLTGFLDDLLLRDVWVDTLGTVFRYMQERVASTLIVVGKSDAQIVLEVTHGLDPAIYDLPLTIRSVVPGGWSLVGVLQGEGYDLVEAVLEGGARVIYYEVLPNGGPVTLVPDLIINMAPAVDAGADLSTTLPAGTLPLNGTALDDGLPAPPGALTLQWSLVSGPASVIFGNAASAVTTVTVTQAGVYVLQLSAGDGALVSKDSLSVTVAEEPVGVQTLELRVKQGADDVEESLVGAMYLDSSDLELVFDYYNGPGEQAVGLRYTGVQIPAGASITKAWIRFQVDEADAGATSLLIHGQAADNAQAFTLFDDDLTNRPTTVTQVPWAPGVWSVLGEEGPAQETPDLAGLVQEIVGRPGWVPGASMVFVLTGTGRRTAVSCDADPNGAPLLHVEYTTGPPVNKAPVVAAGPDGTASLPDATLLLSGALADDGLPSPGTLTSQWSAVGGPAAVGIATPAALATLVTFSVPGVYTLRLSASDGALEASDDVTITVLEAGSNAEIFEVRVASGTDDAEEAAAGSVYLDSSDLELVYDAYNGPGNQVLGLRFTGVDVPYGAVITAAWVDFTVDEASSEATNLAFYGQDADDAPAFTTAGFNVSSRPLTTALATWSPAPWTAVGVSGPAQRTSDLSGLIQEIVVRDGWFAGNALALVITGTGHRVAVSVDGNANAAPLLHVEYVMSGEPINQAPKVDAGSDLAITLPEDTVDLSGSVTDDGLPDPPGSITSLWTLLSGPGPVDFVDPEAAQTQAIFSLAGTYVLQLVAADGALLGGDTVTVVVSAPGGSTVVEIKIAAGANDAEESAAGAMYMDSSDLELVFDYWNGSAEQVVGLRFTGVQVPQGATITAAWIRFQVDESSADATSLLIHAHDVDNGPAFTTTSKNLSTRPKTTSQVPWAPGSWLTPGLTQETPDLSLVLQEIVDRGGWSAGNAMVFLVTGTGRRVAESYEGSAAGAALLHLEYTAPGRVGPPRGQ
ncbi:MAG: polysaccharide deacetylase family protein [Pseudomonadota bacterium]